MGFEDLSQDMQEEVARNSLLDNIEYYNNYEPGENPLAESTYGPPGINLAGMLSFLRGDDTEKTSSVCVKTPLLDKIAGRTPGVPDATGPYGRGMGPGGGRSDGTGLMGGGPGPSDPILEVIRKKQKAGKELTEAERMIIARTALLR